MVTNLYGTQPLKKLPTHPPRSHFQAVDPLNAYRMDTHTCSPFSGMSCVRWPSESKGIVPNSKAASPCVKTGDTFSAERERRERERERESKRWPAMK